MTLATRYTGFIALILLTGACGDIPFDPLCRDPARYDGQVVSDRSFIVMYEDGVDGVVMTERLSRIYGFTPRVFESGGGFSAVLTPYQLRALRCTPEVSSISANIWVIPQGSESVP